jgi:hypothetical protein
MDMSTPLSNDDYNTGSQSLPIQDTNPDIANSILDKLNNMNISPTPGYQGDLPPINPEIPSMEHDMEQRNMNAQLEQMRYMNPIQHIEAQKAQMMSRQQQQQDYENDDDDDDDEDQYEIVVEKNPLWKKILNELRIVVFITMMCLFLFNLHFNKLITQTVPLFRLNNYTYDTNMIGTVIKALMVGILSYGLIRFVKF